MYEPLVDIDGKYLKEIYKEVITLDSNKIWKQDKTNKKEYVTNR